VSSGKAEIVAAHALVRDLLPVRPRRYWTELVACSALGWLALAVAISQAPRSITMWAALAASTVLLHRAAVFMHELTHQRRTDLPGFHLAWNLLVGVPLLLPSIMYEGPHRHHHMPTTYGTSDDPEYLGFSGRPVQVGLHLVTSALIPLFVMVRYLLLAPISWFVPPLRTLVKGYASTFGFNLSYCRRMNLEEERRLFASEVLLLVFWIPAIAALVVGWLPLRWIALWYAMYAALVAMHRVFELTAHRYLSGGRQLGHLEQLEDSVTTIAHWWTVLWAPLGLRYHALHHLFPRLPYHNLAAAHRRLMSSLPADATYRTTLSPSLTHGLRRLIRPRGRTGHA